MNNGYLLFKLVLPHHQIFLEWFKIWIVFQNLELAVMLDWGRNGCFGRGNFFLFLGFSLDILGDGLVLGYLISS
jgi:hypothetical protein